MCLVALCGHKEQDSSTGGATTAFRRLCVETLREMAVVNPAMVCAVSVALGRLLDLLVRMVFSGSEVIAQRPVRLTPLECFSALSVS
jgi:hypothetical protein